MRNLLVFWFCLALAGVASAQEDDSLHTQLEQAGSEELDTLEYYTGDHYKETVFDALADSLAIEKRSFGQEDLRSLKADPDLSYDIPPTVAESLWDRFLIWLLQMFNGLSSETTDWLTISVYVVGLAIVVVVIFMMLKVNAFKVLFLGHGAQNYQVLEENIHEMDFEQLIQQAIDQQDYRRGIRLLFLYALKLLSDRHLIQWNSGKTNHEYVSELHRGDLKSGFDDLSFYFDYAWYGNFTVSQRLFNRVYDTFTTWRSKLD